MSSSGIVVPVMGRSDLIQLHKKLRFAPVAVGITMMECVANDDDI